MTVEEIIKQVRFCIDEETNNTSEINDEKDDLYMDNIIKAKINDAMRWVCVTASSTLLEGKDKSADTSFNKTLNFSSGSAGYNMSWNEQFNIGLITIPSDMNFIRSVRVRGNDWYRAVLNPVEEDSEEELAMFNETSMGTYDRPQVAIVRTTPLKLMVQPASDSFEVNVVAMPSAVSSSTSASTDIPVPEKLRGAFIYYIAFLLLSAYDDTKANQMYTIALQQLGANSQRSK